ncbi:MAG: nucleotidyltransferase family protein [Bryobacteraceae bacterium]|jgi:hypothetical protein
MDYESLLSQAEHRGLTPLLYWCLNESCPEFVPEATLDLLRAAFRAAAQKSLLLTGELFRIMAAFRSSQIPVVPLKGPTLAWSLYPHPALRPFSDLDLLVKRQDVLSARAVLRALGYDDSLREEQIGSRFLKWNEELPFRHQPSGAAVDLHWGAGPQHFSLSSFEASWEHLVPIDVAGRPVPAFCPEDQLRFLCVHGAKHGWPSLLWLSDVARLVSLPSLDWDRFLAGCHRGPLLRTVQLGLLLARNVLEAQIPPAVLRRLDLSTDTLAYTIAYNQLLSPSPWRDRFREFRFQSRLLEGLGPKLGLWWSMFAPSPLDLAQIRLPARCFPLYYLIRASRLIARTL